ncbi:MAG: hypothetical protein A2W90_01645 [Bacteroidetes bacterium GWF2_42_66]|nr:MAG: hypothetical protein A2W92_11950 [Bacteroidetes bacterium GWA2_42_15]OFY01069.1 MAG: hypothetical protein A2W89_15130 [Bacteroidetes bacterium GWE2_42_39]OFY41912.1 MAG: hypothetical protein A2W90_01645 [Bacteroidetes bacterium GWF2_42_66]HBL77904.1 hypothetical protein [Prolixibacteraceae bacterium]HCU63385.1 hypothetical protein [Prolixibacteraceae bacterium]
MEYLLREIDDLVLSCMNPSPSELPSPEKPDALFLEIKAEAGKFKFELSKSLSSLENEKTGKQLVKNHLRQLVFLSDSLCRDILLVRKNGNPWKTGQLAVCFRVLAVLENLQQYLLRKYPAHWNTDQPVSLFNRQKTVKCFRAKLSKCPIENKGTRNELLCIALNPFIHLIRNKKRSLSFGRKDYLVRLLKILHWYVSASSSQAEIGRPLMDSLFTLNYNSVGYLNYYTRQIEDNIQSLDSLKDKIEKLYFHLKTANQRLIDTTACFNPKQTNVKEFISHWILEEICFLEKRMVLLAHPDTGHQLIDHNFKIVTELSVAQVACFIRLLVESGVIKNKNRKELITFYAIYTQSKKQENISPDSFRMRFYNIEESARLEIRSTIIQLLNQINRL